MQHSLKPAQNLSVVTPDVKSVSRRPTGVLFLDWDSTLVFGKEGSPLVGEFLDAGKVQRIFIKMHHIFGRIHIVTARSGYAGILKQLEVLLYPFPDNINFHCVLTRSEAWDNQGKQLPHTTTPQFAESLAQKKEAVILALKSKYGLAETDYLFCDDYPKIVSKVKQHTQTILAASEEKPVHLDAILEFVDTLEIKYKDEIAREKEIRLEEERKKELERKRLAELEAKRLADIEAARLAKLEAKRLAELEAKRLAELEAKRLADIEAKRLAELEAKRQRVAKQSSEAEAAYSIYLKHLQPKPWHRHFLLNHCTSHELLKAVRDAADQYAKAKVFCLRIKSNKKVGELIRSLESLQDPRTINKKIQCYLNFGEGSWWSTSFKTLLNNELDNLAKKKSRGNSFPQMNDALSDSKHTKSHGHQ